MAEPRLDCLDGLPVSDEKRRLEVPQRVEAEPFAETGTLHKGPPNVREARPSDRLALIVGEHEAVRRCRKRRKVRRKRINDHGGKRNRATRGVGLGRRKRWVRTSTPRLAASP